MTGFLRDNPFLRGADPLETFIPKNKAKDKLLPKLMQAFPDLDMEGVMLASMVYQSGAGFMEMMNTHFSRYGISQGRFGILLMLHLDDETSWTPAELAEQGNISRATMTGLLDGLEKQGYLSRSPHPEDRRRITIQLSSAGRKFVNEMLPDHYARLAAAMAPLTPAERKTIMRILPRLMECFASLPADLNG